MCHNSSGTATTDSIATFASPSFCKKSLIVILKLYTDSTIILLLMLRQFCLILFYFLSYFAHSFTILNSNPKHLTNPDYKNKHLTTKNIEHWQRECTSV